jgi:hypothetical protein
MQTLRDENERLGGHRNPLQRIHHLQAVKQERNDLKLVCHLALLFPYRQARSASLYVGAEST